VIFLVVALRASDGTRSLARRAWLRIAIIFAVVGVVLQVVPFLVRH
jgi:hypothetical protein